MGSSTSDPLHNLSLRRLRIRELSRYYCATSSRPPSPSPRHSSSQRRERESSTRGSPTLSLKSQPLGNQPQLVALAQLALLRTNTERSLISIIDDKTQFVIAEATRSVSVYDPEIYEHGNGPIIGAQAIDVTQGVCPKSLDAFLDIKLDLSGPDNTADRNHVFIKDLSSEKLTRKQPLLQRLPNILRYYLEVPLRTESGHVLGSICVIDSTARYPGPRDVDQLAEIAKLVMEHLEYTRMKEDHSRAQRLLEGLSHFVKGQSSLSRWSRLTRGQGDIPEVQIDPIAISSATLSPRPGSQDPMAAEVRVPVVPDESESVASTKLSNRRTSDTSTNPNSTNPSSVLSQVMTAVEEAQQVPVPVSVPVDTESNFLVEDTDRSDPQLATSSSSNIRQAFSRASNLVRESMELDATCFLELPQNARSGRVRGVSSKIANHGVHDEPSPADCESLTDSSIEVPTKDGAPKQEPQAWETGLYCHRLGFSTGVNSSLANSNVASRFLTIPARLLSLLAQKYPGGHIFHFDEAGVITSSGDEQINGPTKARPKRGRKAADKLFNYFQNARSMIFLPVYDNDRQHVYAAFLGWTNNPARALQQNEIVYVSAFADSLMCEVMRLSAVALDQAKSDFISSISHELRSPLHGISAACQLLSELERYPHQGEFINMIHICAHTLLDTMDHVLDYSKINHFIEQQKQRHSILRTKNDRQSPSDQEAYSLVSRVDLAATIENTVMSIAAGSQQLPTQSGDIDHRHGTVLDAGQPEAQQRASPIPIVLSISPYTTCFFDTEPGSWRRIVMNLVGNSIKYTSHGYITVDLHCYDAHDQNASKTCMAELKITDTGRGISEQYLRHRLYTPFAQENNLSVGSGLGLSMVNQIVSSLGGQMQVQSEIGTGTQIVVRIPLRKSSVQSIRRSSDATGELSMAYSITFVGFDGHPPLSESATGIPSPRLAALLALKSSVSNTATKLLGLQVVPNDPDVCVIEESFLTSQIDKYDLSKNNLLIIGLDGRRANTIQKLQHANYHYVLPPLGPQRMKDALRSLMKEGKSGSDHDGDDCGEQPHQEQSTKSPPKVSELERMPSSSTDGTSTNRRSSLSHGTVQVADDNHQQQIQQPASHDVTDSAPGNIPETLATPTTPARGRKSSVLLVDDNDINLRLLVACVKRLRTVPYLTATNGQDAFEKLVAALENGDAVPLVLMDVSMPVMDGMESTRKIRAYERSKSIDPAARSRIVAVTSLGSGEAQKDIEGCGFDLYLRKPVNLQIIRDVLTESGMLEPE